MQPAQSVLHIQAALLEAGEVVGVALVGRDRVITFENPRVREGHRVRGEVRRSTISIAREASDDDRYPDLALALGGIDGPAERAGGKQGGTENFPGSVFGNLLMTDEQSNIGSTCW